MASTFKFDIAGFEKQIERVKMQISLGVTDGFHNAQEFMKDIMKIYIQDVVYDAYFPKVYERTGDLKQNVTARVEGDTLYVYVDDEGMDKTPQGVTYPFRVRYGDEEYPYEYPVEGAAFMEPRDWVLVTKMELINHTNQSREFLNIVAKAIQKRL